MRRVLMLTLATAAMAFVTAPAQAAVTLVGTFSGNQCGGAGGFAACFASGTTAGTGAITKAPPGSPSIISVDSSGGFDKGSFGSISGSELVLSLNAITNFLTYTYTAGPGDPSALYLGIFQGGSGLNCAACNNTFQLFYDPNGFTTGTINLSTYFNNKGFSHVDLFDTGAVPEPATWAMMLLGFGGIGMAMRRRRKATVALSQIA